MAEQTAAKKRAHENEIMNTLWSPELMMFPEKFVIYAFPWGEPGTPLANKSGPRTWQREELQKIGAHNLENQYRINRGENPIPYKLAVASGRGPGKTALVAWLILWAMSTRIGSATVVTANTEQQLMSRTWPELGKWHTLAINSTWFERTATTLRPSKLLNLSKTGIDTAYYYAQAQLWSEENPDAFAGLHNDNGLVLIMDEASGIPESIWKVSKGFFTEPVFLRLWIVFSNPRRPSGEFYNCFHGKAEFWNTRHVDSRDVEGIDKAVLNEIIDEYGEDSDEARVEVKGQFPRTGSNQLIGYPVLEEACKREIKREDVAGSAKILSVDVARYGADLSVIQKRQGLLAEVPISFGKLNNMELAGIVANIITLWDPDAVMIGSGGGQGVIDRLRQLNFDIIEVDEGSSADRKDLYINKRIEMWDKAAEWFMAGGVIPNHQRLKDDLSSPVYSYTDRTNKKVLESADAMKKRGLPSLDFGTAFVLGFAFEVVGRRMGKRGNGRGEVTGEFNPFEIEVEKDNAIVDRDMNVRDYYKL